VNLKSFSEWQHTKFFPARICVAKKFFFFKLLLSIFLAYFIETENPIWSAEWDKERGWNELRPYIKVCLSIRDYSSNVKIAFGFIKLKKKMWIERVNWDTFARRTILVGITKQCGKEMQDQKMHLKFSPKFDWMVFFFIFASTRQVNLTWVENGWTPLLWWQTFFWNLDGLIGRNSK